MACCRCPGALCQRIRSPEHVPLDACRKPVKDAYGNPDALLAELLIADAQGAEQPGQRHGARTLYVVVERQDPVAVAVEDLQCGVFAEVFPLQQRVGAYAAHGVDKLVDERVVRLTAEPLVAPAEIERVVEKRFVVGAYVQADRQGCGRVDAGACDVQGKFAHADRHAAGTLITNTQNGLVVGGDNQADFAVFERRFHHRFQPPAHARIQPQPSSALKHVTEVLRGKADRRCVDDRHQHFHVVHEHAVEKVLVAVLHRGKIHVLAQRVVYAGQRLHGALLLLHHRAHVRRQQSVKAQRLALLQREGAAFVEQRVLNDGGAALGCADTPLGVKVFAQHVRSLVPRVAMRKSCASYVRGPGSDSAAPKKFPGQSSASSANLA